jgi:hypothetical protein
LAAFVLVIVHPCKTECCSIACRSA